MVEAGNILGVFAAALLLMAAIAWVKLIRGPLLQRTGGHMGIDPAQGEFASELLFWAAGLSSAAVFLAISGWVFR
jgi:hypothetical protein